MDFDSFIPFILILLFFVGPTIFKQWQKKQKKSSSGQKRGTGIFGKIGDQIRQFVKDLEEQALEAKKKADQDQGQHTAWDNLREENEQDTGFYDSGDEIELPYSQEVEIEKEPTPEPVRVEATPAPSEERGYRKAPLQQGQFKSNYLQNAVVWSEILSKPIALRED